MEHWATFDAEMVEAICCVSKIAREMDGLLLKMNDVTPENEMKGGLLELSKKDGKRQ